jgi:hypothetical protein
MPDETIPFDGGEIHSDPETNRVIIRFDAKPEEYVASRLKALGFKWSPGSRAWQRLRSRAALQMALGVVAKE